MEVIKIMKFIFSKLKQMMENLITDKKQSSKNYIVIISNPTIINIKFYTF